MKRKACRFISVLLCISMITALCPGCGTKEKQGTRSADEFDDWVKELFVESVQESTLDLHYVLEYPENYGITDYDVTLGECSQEAADESAKENEEALEELEDFNYDALDADQKLTYDILKDRLELSIESADYPYYDEPLSPMIGVQSELPSTLSEYNLNTKKDVEDYLGLLKDTERYFGELLTYEQEKSEAGLFMSDKILDMLIEDLDSFIKDADDSFMIETFEERIRNVPDLTDQEIKSYCDQNESLVTGEMVNAYKNLKEGLKKLRGTGKNEGGLGNFKKGRAYYQYLIRVNVGSDKTVSKLEKLSSNRINTDIETFTELYYGDQDLADQFDDFHFTLTDPEEILADLQQKMLNDFPELNTSVNVEIKKVSKSLEESTSPAYYLMSALDDLHDNVIYINDGYSDKSTLYTLLAHEGYPGHLYQTVYSGTCSKEPIRRLLETSGYSEGWATYVEQMAYYYDHNKDQDLLTMMQSNSALSLGLYAMADYYINYEKCTKSEIKDWISDYMAFDSEAFDEFYYAILSQPANYLNYYVGYLEFLNLREEAEDALGDDLDLKAFHTFLLETGNAPFYIIEDRLKDWLAEEETAADEAA